MTQEEFEKEFVGKVICGDCLVVMKDWPDGCVDTIINDLPYGIGFMGKDWDTFNPEEVAKQMKRDTRTQKRRKLYGGRESDAPSPAMASARYDHSRNAEFQEWCKTWATEALRVAKPGAIMLAFGGTRTFHRLTCAIEDAGWEIRDCMMWLYGSGFPKSLDISKAIDKAAVITCPVCNGDGRARIDGRDVGVCLRCDGDCIVKGAEREVVGKKRVTRILDPETLRKDNYTVGASATGGDIPVSSPATDLAKLWDGWGTALKPAWEPIIVAMKPCEGTFAENAEKHGVAGLCIDGARIPGEPWKWGTQTDIRGGGLCSRRPSQGDVFAQNIEGGHQGRWPANVILDEQAGAMVDEMSGERKSGAMTKAYKYTNTGTSFGKPAGATRQIHEANSGGASRFFYCAKASRSERGKDNNHPTVKPLALMEYLCKLTRTPRGGIVLDMFGGSGTTALACIKTGRKYVLIDNKPAYCEIARRRVQAARAGQKALFEWMNTPSKDESIKI